MAGWQPRSRPPDQNRQPHNADVTTRRFHGFGFRVGSSRSLLRSRVQGPHKGHKHKHFAGQSLPCWASFSGGQNEIPMLVFAYVQFWRPRVVYGFGPGFRKESVSKGVLKLQRHACAHTHTHTYTYEIPRSESYEPTPEFGIETQNERLLHERPQAFQAQVPKPRKPELQAGTLQRRET